MTEKQLKNLSRVDLMELLLEQTKYVNSLELELSALRKKLKYSEQSADSAPSSMADASLRVNGVFEAADEAARQYVEKAEKYEELKHAIFEESGSAGAGHTWNAVGPAPVPEPTGGTLALLGLALLGLKRKRFKTVDTMT